MKHILKKSLRYIKSFTTGLYVVPQTMEHLKNIRVYESELLINDLSKNTSILEIGAGAGWQAEVLNAHGYDVQAIDIMDTNYKESQVFPVIDYDGHKIPFKNNAFDVVFSSNFLEHIPHIVEFQMEIRRVLKDDGICIHLLPTSSWRFWTNLTVMLKKLKFASVHGETASNILSELYYFSKGYWDKLFLNSGWKIKQYKSNKIFYTGASLMDNRLSIKQRKKLSKYLGSSCHYYILTKDNKCIA